MARTTFLMAIAALLNSAAAASADDWPSFGHDAASTRYSPLAQIDARNVHKLKPAWVFHMRPDPPVMPADAPAVQAMRFAASGSTPLMVDGLLYLTTPYRRVVALAPDTGKLVWQYVLTGLGQAAPRGLSYWRGDSRSRARIIFGTTDGRMIALDAKTGLPLAAFGDAGILNLRTPEFIRGFESSQYSLSSPPAIYKDILITGVRVTEGPGPGPSGAVRALDIRTGRPLWSFDAVPREGAPGAETWESGSTVNRTGSNVWGFITVDSERGIAYLPFGAAAWDRYGGDRKGDNLFTTTLVAVEASTGKYLWHFQPVHHDIWDFDLGAAPVLIDVDRDGRKIPALALVGKNGLVFILNRVSGKSLYEVEERAVPKSDVPGEVAAATQPFPLKPEPIARQSITAAEVADVAPEHRRFCLDLQGKLKLSFGGPYQPTRLNRATVQFPGLLGGADWGGAAADPARGLIFVNTHDLGDIMQLDPSSGGEVPYRNQRKGKYWQQDTRLPCNPTPWGQLIAIDVHTGKFAWRSTLGITDTLPPERQLTGRPNMGGPIVTGGGLVFIGATDDSRFRAFDARTGGELWTFKLAASAHAVPITYAAGGKQFVTIVSTGGGVLLTPTTSDAVTAFALP
ncbi:MAG TPA: PQQ-binding-like beta-propeller repeat protein [Sphingomicrobium sp.]|jgi:quinoprotein glucose dehydrogenase